jgi:hypothetical protein
VARLAAGVLRQDRSGTEGRDAGLLSSRRGLSFNLRHQGRDAAMSLCVRQVLPAGQGIEGQSLRRGVLQPIELFLAVAGGILLGAVEPVAFELLLAKQETGQTTVTMGSPTLASATVATLRYRRTAATRRTVTRWIGALSRADRPSLESAQSNLVCPTGLLP